MLRIYQKIGLKDYTKQGYLWFHNLTFLNVSHQNVKVIDEVKDKPCFHGISFKMCITDTYNFLILIRLWFMLKYPMYSSQGTCFLCLTDFMETWKTKVLSCTEKSNLNLDFIEIRCKMNQIVIGLLKLARICRNSFVD